MPRIRLKAALIGIAIVALWLASFQMSDAGSDIRHCIYFCVIVLPIFAGVLLRGGPRAFWSGFAVTFAAHALSVGSTPMWMKFMYSYVPHFEYTDELAYYLAPDNQIIGSAIQQSIRLAYMIVFSLLVGSAAVLIYRSGRQADRNR